MNTTYLSDIKPFKMHGNIYFVGSTKVSVHLIDTECGLVLIDTGYPDMYEQILDSIAYLGYNPKNIVAIFHSHGHIDHFGCTNELKELTGAKTYISRIDNEIANGTLDLSWAKEVNMDRIKPFDGDVLIDDGDVFTFGSTTIRCRLAPGHTEGTLAFFVTYEENGKKFTAAMHGGVGSNSMTSKFLNEYGLSFDCRDKFREGLRNMKDENVDFVLGNHPQQNKTEDKLRKIEAGESIIDKNEWKEFLIWAEGKLDEMIEREKF